MVTTRIYHSVTKLPVASTLLLMGATYEVHRIHRGTHPRITPLLESNGIVNSRNRTAADSTGGVASATGDSAAVSNVPLITWTMLNGIPIPTLTSLVKPAGSE